MNIPIIFMDVALIHNNFIVNVNLHTILMGSFMRTSAKLFVHIALDAKGMP